MVENKQLLDFFTKMCSDKFYYLRSKQPGAAQEFHQPITRSVTVTDQSQAAPSRLMRSECNSNAVSPRSSYAHPALPLQKQMTVESEHTPAAQKYQSRVKFVRQGQVQGYLEQMEAAELRQSQMAQRALNYSSSL